MEKCYRHPKLKKTVYVLERDFSATAPKQKWVTDITEFKTKEEIVDAVRDYLDYYDHRRIQLKLKGLSPIQYRKQSFK